MRFFVMVLGVVIGLVAVFMARGCLARARDTERQITGIETRMALRQKELERLSAFPRQPPSGLEVSYASVVNDLYVLARAHGVVGAVSIKGSGDGDVLHAAGAADMEGLRQMALTAVFTGVSSEVALLALLDGITSFEAALPVIIRDLRYEKNRVTLELAVVGS